MTEALEIELPSALAEATDALARTIMQAEPVALFQRAQDRYERDAEARGRLELLVSLQQRIRQRQVAGQVSAEDLTELRAARTAVDGDRVIADYWQARRVAVAHLRSVNDAVSRLLGVDFAALAQRPGPC